MGLVALVAVVAAFVAAWDQYSHATFAMICVCAAIGAMAAMKHSETSAKAKKSGTKIEDDTGSACLFWVAWKFAGVAALLLLGAVIGQWF